MRSVFYSFLVCIAVIVFHILYIFQDQSFFDRQFSALWSYERQESVMDEAIILMRYRKNIDVLVASDVYAQAEKDHLYDVKELLYRIEYLFVLCIFILWLGFRSFDVVVFGKVLFVICIFGLWLLFVWWFAWDWLFDRFHRLFFVGNWLFSADSFLIQSYPWEFFRNAMVRVSWISGVSLLLLVLISYLFRKIRHKFID